MPCNLSPDPVIARKLPGTWDGLLAQTTLSVLDAWLALHFVSHKLYKAHRILF